MDMDMEFLRGKKVQLENSLKFQGIGRVPWSTLERKILGVGSNWKNPLWRVNEYFLEPNILVWKINLFQRKKWNHVIPCRPCIFHLDPVFSIRPCVFHTPQYPVPHVFYRPQDPIPQTTLPCTLWPWVFHLALVNYSYQAFFFSPSPCC